MNIKEIRKEIEKVKSRASSFTNKNRSIDDAPSHPGKYCISVEGVDFFDAVFLQHDGNKWLDLEQYTSLVDGDMKKISYLDVDPEPVLIKPRKKIS